MSEPGTGLNVSFTYRNIAHVEALREGQTEDDFRAEVIERYRRLDAKRDGVPEPVETKPAPKPKRPKPDMPVAKPVEEPDTAEPQVKLEQDYRVIAAKGVGWYNVVDGAGVPANSKALRKAIAEELAKQMNKPGNPPKQDEGV